MASFGNTSKKRSNQVQNQALDRAEGTVRIGNQALDEYGEVLDPSYLQVQHVSRTFDTPNGKLEVLRDINFQVARGEIVCIVGASGCGKSTLLRAIAGLDMGHEGDVIIDGKKVTRPEKSHGMVFQEHRLFPWLTVEQNVGYALDGVSKEEKARRVKEYIDLVGLTGFEKSYPGQLSGGMAQRGGIARALVNEPSVLLLDEPFGALDTFTKISMQEELKRIQKESRTTMVMVTHDIDEAVYLSNHVVVLSSRPGTIREIIKVELSEPRNRNSYEFLEIRRKIYQLFFEEKQLEPEYSI